MLDSRIVYMCSATKGAIVNFVPIAEIGKDRIAKIVILRGLNEPPNLRDRVEAIGPAENLKQTLVDRGFDRERISYVDGNPFDLEFWRSRVSELAGNHEADNQAIWLNITSGTRDMALGALFALLGEGKRGHRVMMVKGDPLRVEWPLEQFVVPESKRAEPLDLATYLSLYGFMEMQGEDRAQRQQSAWNSRVSAARVYQAFVHSGIKGVNSGDVIGSMNGMLHPYDPGRSSFPLSLPWQNVKGGNSILAAVQAVMLAAGGCVHVVTDDAKITIKDKAALKFLKGGWLEEIAYIRVREAIGESAFLNVRLGVPAAGGRGANSLQEFNELDCGAMVGGQLHIIECKTGQFSNSGGTEGAGQNAINKLTFFRDSLLGQFGTLVLLNPRRIAPGSSAAVGLEQMRQRGRFVSVELHTGEDAMATMTKQFAALT